MVDYPVFTPLLATLTWDTFLTLRGTWGFYLDLVVPLTPFKSVLDIVLLEHGELPCVLPCAVHLDLGHLPDTQGFFELFWPQTRSLSL